MTIAIIIATHGNAAVQLLKTTEMLVGSQENIYCVDFVPGENTETLVDKYQRELSQCDISEGILFLVDTWGGSPFNAACRVAQSHSGCEVVTGVNIPMLTETLMFREDHPSLSELVSLALEAGREGVRSLNEVRKPSPTLPIETAPVTPQPTRPEPEHQQICLVRIDDRLIHGQVVTRWTKDTRVTRIVVPSDEVAGDHVRKTLLTQVAPPGVTAHVVDIDKLIRVLNNPRYAQDRIMLLFTNPTDVDRAVERGMRITSVNIGGMAFRQGKTQVTNAVSVDQQDIAAFRRLHARGIELEVRKVAGDPRLSMMDLINHPRVKSQRG